MYDIKQLEEEWKRYRKKKLKPWYVSSAVFIGLSLSSIMLLTNKKIDLTEVNTYFSNGITSFEYEEKSKASLSSEKKNIKEIVLVNDALNKLEVKDGVIDISNKKVVKKSPNILVDIPILDDKQESLLEEGSKTRKKVHLEIVESSNVTAYKDVEKRFSESRNIDDALFLAKSYYRKAEYKKAGYWALQANKLDQNVEDSLLIFVKSKVKMGYKNEAISILTSYVKKSDSQEVRKLLYQIENDKL